MHAIQTHDVRVPIRCLTAGLYLHGAKKNPAFIPPKESYSSVFGGVALLHIPAARWHRLDARHQSAVLPVLAAALVLSNRRVRLLRRKRRACRRHGARATREMAGGCGVSRSNNSGRRSRNRSGDVRQKRLRAAAGRSSGEGDRRIPKARGSWTRDF